MHTCTMADMFAVLNRAADSLKIFSICTQIILFIYRNWFANLQDLKNCKNKLPFQGLRERVHGTIKYYVNLLESGYFDVIFSCLSSWCSESK